MKILYITTIGTTMGFFKSLIKQLVEEGNKIDIACNETEKVPDLFRELGCKIYKLSCSRSPFNPGNFKAIKEIKQIAKDGGYDIIHCHTPIASACARLACKKLRKNGLRVIYTAHGFHFYTGAPLKNWLVFYPIEKLCSKWTDVLITINKEDFERAKAKFKAKKVEYVPGVGVDIDKFANTVIDRDKKREELGVKTEDTLLLSVGELNENKNHITVLKALASMSDEQRAKYVYLIAGVGDKKDELEAYAKENNIRLILAGFRTDVAELYKAADIYVHPSFREGLPVSVIEAMASGVTSIASNIRGCADLIKTEYLFDPNDYSDLLKLISSDQLKTKKVIYDFTSMKTTEVVSKIKGIYVDSTQKLQ